jgi:hypothetical protein
MKKSSYGWLLLSLLLVVGLAQAADDLPPEPPAFAAWLLENPAAPKTWAEANAKKDAALTREPIIQMHDEYVAPFWVSLYSRVNELSDNHNADPVMEGYYRLIMDGGADSLLDRFTIEVDTAHQALGNAELGIIRLRPLAASDHADATSVWRLASFAVIYFGKYDEAVARANPMADEIETILDAADQYRLGIGGGY